MQTKLQGIYNTPNLIIFFIFCQYLTDEIHVIDKINSVIFQHSFFFRYAFVPEDVTIENYNLNGKYAVVDASCIDLSMRVIIYVQNLILFICQHNVANVR